VSDKRNMITDGCDPHGCIIAIITERGVIKPSELASRFST